MPLKIPTTLFYLGAFLNKIQITQKILLNYPSTITEPKL